MTIGNGTLRSVVLASIRNRRNRPPGPSEPFSREQGALVVASYNVHKCVGGDGRFDPNRIIDVIREIRPDVLALQEADQRFGERAGLLDLPRLRHETGLEPVPLAERHSAKSHGWRGNMILVREGVAREVHQLKLPGLEPRGALIAEIDLGAGRGLRVVAAHLGLLNWARRRQADMLIGLIAAREERPTLLMGDFNEWRLDQRSALTRLENAFGPLPRPLPSFPARMPVFSLDRIIANRPHLITEIRVHDTPLARLASDHLPIAARLEFGAA